MIAFFLNRWVLMTLAVVALVPAFFARILWEHYADRAHTMIASTDQPIEVQVPEIRTAKVRYDRPLNDASQIRLTDTKFETRSAGLTVMSAHLVNDATGNDYPNLVLDIKSSDGSLLRTVELTPAQYQHAAVLTDEHIRFNVDLRDGETRIAAHPSYPTPAPPPPAPASAPPPPP